MQKPHRLLGFAVFLVVFAFCSAAFAQATPSAPVNETTGIIMGLSAALGILTNWIQTGTLLGRWITPKTWLPDVTMLATFLGGFLGSVESANPVTLSGSAIYTAVIAGIMSLTAGVAPTLARHVHANLNEQQRALIAAAKKPVVAAAAAAATAIALMIGLGTQTGCNGQPVLPTVLNIVQTVENDVNAGDSAPQIDADVCKDLGGSATTDAVCAGVTVLVQDALQLLLDGGKLTPAQVATINSYYAVHPKVTAPAGGGK